MSRARKAENETRTNFTVRLSTGERERVLHNARLLKMTPSDYGRVCMMQGPAKVIHEAGHDPEKVRALLAVGNNLNQIARHANAASSTHLDVYKRQRINGLANSPQPRRFPSVSGDSL